VSTTTPTDTALDSLPDDGPRPLRAALTVLAEDGRTVISIHRLDAAQPRMLRVGRSLECDVIVDDAHVAPVHAEVGFDGDGRLLVGDLGSYNGTHLVVNRRGEPGFRSGERRVTREVAVGEGVHALRVGRTRLRLNAQSAVIAAELPLRPGTIDDAAPHLRPASQGDAAAGAMHDVSVESIVPGGADAATPWASTATGGATHGQGGVSASGKVASTLPKLAAWAGGKPFVWLALTTVVWLAFTTWSELGQHRDSGVKAAGAVLGAAAVIAVWVGLWALVGRVINGVPRWTVHACIVLAVALVYQGAAWVVDTLGFSLGTIVPDWLGWWWMALCGLVLLWLHLRAATHLRRWRVGALAALLPVVMLTMNYWSAFGTRSGQDMRQVSGVSMSPPSMRLRKLPTADVLITEAEALAGEAVRAKERAEGEDSGPEDEYE
jgi:hypothetical protein